MFKKLLLRTISPPNQPTNQTKMKQDIYQQTNRATQSKQTTKANQPKPTNQPAAQLSEAIQQESPPTFNQSTNERFNHPFCFLMRFR